MKQKLGITKKVESLGLAILVMGGGLILFKLIPMLIWGKNILFDASMHVIIASLILYIVYLPIEHNKHLKFSYVLFSIIVLVFVGVQRYSVYEHNLFGIALGLLISFAGILIAKRFEKKHNKKIKKRKGK